jgi:hypothetical protein
MCGPRLSFFYWDGISLTLCPCWIRTVILLISASWVSGVTGVCLMLSIASIYFFYSFIHSFCGAGVWTWDFSLARQVLYHLDDRNIPWHPAFSFSLEMRVSWTVSQATLKLPFLPISASKWQGLKAWAIGIPDYLLKKILTCLSLSWIRMWVKVLW